MKLKRFEELNEDKKNRYFSSYDEAEKLGEKICDYIVNKGYVFKNDDVFDFYTELNKLLYKYIKKKHTIISDEEHKDSQK